MRKSRLTHLEIVTFYTKTLKSIRQILKAAAGRTCMEFIFMRLQNVPLASAILSSNFDRWCVADSSSLSLPNDLARRAFMGCRVKGDDQTPQRDLASSRAWPVVDEAAAVG